MVLPRYCFPSTECDQAQAAACNSFRAWLSSTLCKNELPREAMAPRSPSALRQIGSVATITPSGAFSSEGLAQLRLWRRQPGSSTQHRAPVPSRHEREAHSICGEDSEPWGRATATLKATHTVRSGEHGFEAGKSDSDHGNRWCGRHIFSGTQSCEFLDRKINDREKINN